MPALAPIRVVGPPPVAPLYSLVSTPGVLIEQSDPVHWRGGAAVDSYPTETPSRHFPCSQGTFRTKAEGSDPPHPEFPSFTVLLPITCSGMGIGNEAGATLLQNRAREAFRARESFGVEQQLILGDPEEPTDPHVGDGNIVLPVGTTFQSPREAVSLLEKAIGETAQQGMLHLDPATFASCPPDYFVVEGSRMRTKRGNTVVIGDGYIGTKPDEYVAELADNEAWVYATGLVRATRDESEEIAALREVFDEETNALTFRAERNYILYWDTALQVGVPVRRSIAP